MEFSAVAVAAALQAEEIEIEDCCERLARRQQFLHRCRKRQLPDGTVTARYGFDHALYQNAFYARLTTAPGGASPANRELSRTHGDQQLRLPLNWRCTLKKDATGNER